MTKKALASIFLFSLPFFLAAQNILQQDITVVGHDSNLGVTELSTKQFKNFRAKSTNPKYGKWYALITNLNGTNPKLHIIDPVFFAKIAQTTIRPKYGMHETYARYNRFAKSSSSYIKTVQSGNGKIIPLELYLPIDFTIDQKSNAINWIIKTKRYKYSQSSAPFSTMLIKAEKLARSTLIDTNIKGTFIDYDKYKTFQRPNSKTSIGRKDIKNLQKNGYNLLSVHEFNKIEHQGENRTEILNAGLFNKETEQYESYGILRYINDYSDTATGLKSYNSLKFIDIPIFSELPESILPVSGIIILEKQTELSHVNILAKNRGTLNVSINIPASHLGIDMLPLAQEINGFDTSLINKAVKITHNKKFLQIEQITPEALQAKYKKQRELHPSVELAKPIFDSNNPWVLDPGGQLLRVNEVGAKAANYGLLERVLGQQFVLKGYAIGFELYEKTIRTKGPLGTPHDLIVKLLEEKDALSSYAVSKRLKQIRNAIQAIPLSNIPRKKTGPSVVDEIAHLLNSTKSPKAMIDSPLSARNLGYHNVGRLRFRSSTNCEDLPMFNGAGLYLSEGCTFMLNGSRSIDSIKVWNKIKNVLSSLWLDKAFSEREYFRISHENASLSIQINPAFSSKWVGGDYMEEWANGVAIFQHKDNRPIYNINSQIGTAAVTNPVEGELSESFIISDAELNVKCLSKVNSETNYIFLNDDDKTLQTDSTIAPLLDQLKYTLRTLYNKMVLYSSNPAMRNPDKYAIDVEFKIMVDKRNNEKRLFLKQVRPLHLF